MNPMLLGRKNGNESAFRSQIDSQLSQRQTSLSPKSTCPISRAHVVQSARIRPLPERQVSAKPVIRTCERHHSPEPTSRVNERIGDYVSIENAVVRQGHKRQTPTQSAGLPADRRAPPGEQEDS